ncbi:hypothetical protein [Methylovulum sp.]|uniref:hypothetical protein n=1 Tax=Methylovulum sp. TaxID=1916980 RepID=UPI00262DC4D3|nr:hypothetical protein [Methylovulum sp.]
MADTKGDCKKPKDCKSQDIDDKDLPEDQICKECDKGSPKDKTETENVFNPTSADLAKIEPGDDPMLNVEKDKTLKDESTYGLTWPESVTVDIDVRCEGGKFKAEMKSLIGNYSLQTRFLPHQHKVSVTGKPGDPSLGNFDEGSYCNQALSLSVLGKVSLPNDQWEYLPYEWYILDAVQKHEEVHLAHYLPALKNAAPEIGDIIKKLSADATPGKTKEQAIAEIKGSDKYKSALVEARDVWFQGHIFWDAIDDHNGPAAEAEHKVVDPVKNSICNYAKTHGWATCAACSP